MGRYDGDNSKWSSQQVQYILGPAAGQHCWQTGRSVCSLRNVCTGTAVSTADLNVHVAYQVTQAEMHMVWCILPFRVAPSD